MHWIQARLLLLLPAQVNTKPGTRKAKKPGKKKKDDPAVEHEDLDDDEEQQPHTQEVEDAAGQLLVPVLVHNCAPYLQPPARLPTPATPSAGLVFWVIVCSQPLLSPLTHQLALTHPKLQTHTHPTCYAPLSDLYCVVVGRSCRPPPNSVGAAGPPGGDPSAHLPAAA